MNSCLEDLVEGQIRDLMDELILYKEGNLHIFWDVSDDCLYCSGYNRRTYLPNSSCGETIVKDIPHDSSLMIHFEKHNRHMISELVESVCNEWVYKKFDGLTIRISYQECLEIHYNLSLQ